MSLHKRLIIIFLALFLVFLCGVIGFMTIEGWSFLDASYMTVITLTTVGFGEVNTLSSAGKIFTMFLIIIGMGILLYGVSSITAFIVEGELMDIIRRRRMDKSISKLKDHCVICGAGKVGRYIIEEFIKTGKDFVVVEKNTESIKKLTGEVLWIEGDASDDAVLLKAGIDKAKGLITALSTDKDNLFVVLTSRELNPKLRIVSRALEEESIHKLKKAGADSIVSTTFIGGMRIASEILRPTVTRFLDTMLREKGDALRIEEVSLSVGSKMVGQTLGEVGVPRKTGLIVIAVKDVKNDKYIYNPDSSLKLNEGDLLIVLGSVNQVDKLKQLGRGSAKKI